MSRTAVMLLLLCDQLYYVPKHTVVSAAACILDLVVKCKLQMADPAAHVSFGVWVENWIPHYAYEQTPVRCNIETRYVYPDPSIHVIMIAKAIHVLLLLLTAVLERSDHLSFTWQHVYRSRSSCRNHSISKADWHCTTNNSTPLKHIAQTQCLQQRHTETRQLFPTCLMATQVGSSVKCGFRFLNQSFDLGQRQALLAPRFSASKRNSTIARLNIFPEGSRQK